MASLAVLGRGQASAVEVVDLPLPAVDAVGPGDHEADRVETSAPLSADQAAEDEAAVLPSDRLVVPVPVRAGASFGLLMQDHGLPARALSDAAADHHDFRVVRADRELQVVYQDGQPEPVGVRYQLDADHTLVLDKGPADWVPTIEEVAYTATPERLELELTHSLWEAGLDAGLRPEDLTRLAQVFEYELDFNTELRAGASLVVVAERLRAEERRPKLGTIHAVRLVNAGRTHEGIRWTLPAEQDEPGAEPVEGWYHPDGTGMQRAFLRSPLGFSSAVTSGFNPRRFHPILKTRRPHNGVDFGARTGTPVRTVSDGVVVTAGWAGGHGNFVKIRHDDHYETSYSHLSAISVRKGQRVEQGDFVGKVGTTGLSTGPHLHFQMWRDGRFVDPLHEDLPTARPLEPADLPAFQARVAFVGPQLDGLTEPATPPEAHGPGEPAADAAEAVAAANPSAG